MEDNIPSKIDKYEIIKEIGRGGMAVVCTNRQVLEYSQILWNNSNKNLQNFLNVLKFIQISKF